MLQAAYSPNDIVESSTMLTFGWMKLEMKMILKLAIWLNPDVKMMDNEQFCSLTEQAF